MRTEACPSTAKETLRLSRVQKRVVERGGVAAWLEEKGGSGAAHTDAIPCCGHSLLPGAGPDPARKTSSPRALPKSDDEVNRVVSSRALDVLLKKDTTGPKRSRWSEACIPKPRLRPKLTAVSTSPRKVILQESIWNRPARARDGQTTGQTPPQRQTGPSGPSVPASALPSPAHKALPPRSAPWSCFLFARGEAACFANHGVKPVRSFTG